MVVTDVLLETAVDAGACIEDSTFTSKPAGTSKALTPPHPVVGDQVEEQAAVAAEEAAK